MGTDKKNWQKLDIYEAALANTPDFVYIFDLDGSFIYCNPALLKVYGKTLEETIGRPLEEHGYEKWHAEMHRKEILEIVETKKSFRGVVPFSGRVYDYILNPVFDDGEVVAVSGTTRDITDRTQMEEALKESREYLELMVESAQDYAIISTDNSARIMSWSSGAERIFGYQPDEAVGEHISMIFTPEDRENDVFKHELNTAIENGRSKDERWHLRKNGERFYANGILATMYDINGEARGFLKIARDMTAEQQAQEDLIAARNAAEAANVAKTEFLANMSHEIRTPMNAVIGLSNILAMSSPLTDKQKEFIETLQMSAESLLELINDLLDITKIEAQTVELENTPFSLAQIINDIRSMMSVRVNEKELAFTCDSKAIEKRLFMGDPVRLRQILLNLCSNAVKFTEKGDIHIGVECEPIAGTNAENVCITIRDTGIGISKDKLETIFDKFVQADNSINRKYGGTGLGLAITKTLAEIMGGTIEVDSEVGVGSTFTVTIPLENATATDLKETTIELEIPNIEDDMEKAKPKVLLVEDYPANILVATMFLAEFGYDYEVANNGIEAIDKIKAGEFDVVLMDVQMHGMNGLEATGVLRAHEEEHSKPRLSIIGMTAHALAGDREKCIASGMDDYIAKPFNPDELQRLLGLHVARTRQLAQAV